LVGTVISSLNVSSSATTIAATQNSIRETLSLIALKTGVLSTLNSQNEQVTFMESLGYQFVQDNSVLDNIELSIDQLLEISIVADDSLILEDLKEDLLEFIPRVEETITIDEQTLNVALMPSEVADFF